MTSNFEEVRNELKVLIKDNSYERRNADDPKNKTFMLGDIDGDFMGYELIIYPRTMDDANNDYWLKHRKGYERKTILTVKGGTMSYNDIADMIISGILKNKKYMED